MPNGRIFVIDCIETDKGERFTHIIEINKRIWSFETRMVSDKHFFFKGAVASSVNGLIYMTGSEFGKTKACTRFDMKGEKPSFSNMPELNFGRHSHAMTVLN